MKFRQGDGNRGLLQVNLQSGGDFGLEPLRGVAAGADVPGDREIDESRGIDLYCAFPNFIQIEHLDGQDIAWEQRDADGG